ncbi:hypothetical protein BU15DRAFT_50177, partial [Melanogaster broomeanus]
RNLIVCIDGTANKFGHNNTNVVKLFAKLELHSRNNERITPSGIGTRPMAWHAISRFQRMFLDCFDEAIAWNVEEIVQDSYRWLASEYREGDQIYLFGFSRGAYQVRVLAGLLYEVVPHTHSTYNDNSADVYIHCRSDFKKTFCRDDMKKVHFVGVWDTVSSVGLVKEDVFLSSSSSVDHACHFRHALALDERRVKFMPEYFHEMNTITTIKMSNDRRKTSKYLRYDKRKADCARKSKATDGEKSEVTDVENFQAIDVNPYANIKEVWFAGSHSDVYVFTQSFRNCVFDTSLFRVVGGIDLERASTRECFAPVDASGGHCMWSDLETSRHILDAC